MMKKSVLSLIVGSAMLIAPMTASALTPMTADGMKDATGQAGVSIAVDNVKLESHVGATSYIDIDGYATYNGSGTAVADAEASIVIGAKHKVQYINAIIGAADATPTTDPNYVGSFVGQTSTYAQDMTGVDYKYVNTLDDADNETLFRTRALTIDAGTCTALTDGMNANLALVFAGGYTAADEAGLGKYIYIDGALNAAGTAAYATKVTGVVIGLPTLEIHTSADEYSISAVQGTSPALGGTGAINSGKDFIKISKGQSTLAILGGTLEIAPH